MAFRKSAKTLNTQELYDYAVKALAARAHSISELRQKLMRRAEPDADIDNVLARLKEYGYLNDKRFAEGFAAARLENRGFGKVRVLQDLKQRRVAPKLAEETVSNVFQGKDEATLVEQFLERKYRSTPLSEHLKDDRHLAAVYRRLRRAGFSHGITIGVLLRHAKEAAKLEDMETGEDGGQETEDGSQKSEDRSQDN